MTWGPWGDVEGPEGPGGCRGSWCMGEEGCNNTKIDDNGGRGALCNHMDSCHKSDEILF